MLNRNDTTMSLFLRNGTLWHISNCTSDKIETQAFRIVCTRGDGFQIMTKTKQLPISQVLVLHINFFITRNKNPHDFNFVCFVCKRTCVFVCVCVSIRIGLWVFIDKRDVRQSYLAFLLLNIYMEQIIKAINKYLEQALVASVFIKWCVTLKMLLQIRFKFLNAIFGLRCDAVVRLDSLEDKKVQLTNKMCLNRGCSR